MLGQQKALQTYAKGGTKELQEEANDDEEEDEPEQDGAGMGTENVAVEKHVMSEALQTYAKATTKGPQEETNDDEEEDEQEQDGGGMGTENVVADKHVMDVDTMSGDKQVRSADSITNPANQSSSTTSSTAVQSSFISPSFSREASPHPSTTSSKPSASLPAASQERTTPDAAEPLSTRASSRKVPKALSREDDDPKYWSFDAANYLRKTLAGFEIEKAIYWMKELDLALGFPKGSVSRFPLCLVALRMTCTHFSFRIKPLN